jgi:hypothetical protein
MLLPGNCNKVKLTATDQTLCTVPYTTAEQYAYVANTWIIILNTVLTCIIYTH